MRRGSGREISRSRGLCPEPDGEYHDGQEFVLYPDKAEVSKRWHVVVSSDTINIQEIGTFSYLGFCPMDATENVLVVFDIETENHCARGCIGLSGTLQRGS